MRFLIPAMPRRENYTIVAALMFIMIPDYAPSSANFSKRYGIGGVRVATQPRRGIMVARS